MNKVNKYSLILCLVVLSIVGSLLPSIIYPQRSDAFYWPWQDTKCDIVVQNGAVTVDNDIVWMESKPDILYNSGWVEFSFIAKHYSGSIDIVCGFNGDDGVKIIKAEVYEPYTKTRNKSVKTGIFYDEFNESTGKIEKVEKIIQAEEEYVTTDWHKKEIKRENKYQSSTVNNVIAGKLYKSRVWVDVPITLGNIDGKYVIGIKPSNMTIDEARLMGDLFLIDPWYNSSFNTRKAFTVNNTGGLLTNYQIKLDVNTGSGTDNETSVYLNSRSLNWPYDIRFTNSDEITTLDFWIEEYDGTDGSFWVELDSVAAGANTFYIYYGNASATDVADGADTFIIFEDFEWGSNGDAITDSGGSVTWTIVQGNIDISTDHDYGVGSRSMKMVANNPKDLVTMPLPDSDTQAIQCRVWKENTPELRLYHSDAATQIQLEFNATEDLRYYTAAWNDTGQNGQIDEWAWTEIYDMTFTGANTFDWDWEDSVINVNLGNNLGMRVISQYDNKLAFENNVITDDIYIDNILVRNWVSAEPDIISWGTVEYYYGLTTEFCTGFNRVWAILNSNLTGGASPGAIVTERGFQYGLTPSYGDNVSATNVSIGNHRLLVSGLEPATQYHYRAYAILNGVVRYGSDRTFSTKGKPTLYENYVGSNQDRDIYGSNWAYQTFSTDNVSNSAHSVSHVWLRLQRVGTLTGDLNVSIRNAAGGKPTGIDLTSGMVDGAIISDNDTGYSWYEVEMEEEYYLSDNVSYAVVLSAQSDNATHFVQWQYEDTGGYGYGQAGFSENNGYTWNATAYDQLFEVWGNPAILVYSAKVFTGYLEDGDWLITCHYKNLYPPYFEDGKDVSQYFYLQLSDNVSAKAQTVVPRWEEAPASIYLSAAEVQSLEWGKEYSVRLIGNFCCNPYMEYMLQLEDWIGDDLTRLDSYVFDIARLLEDYYEIDLLTSVAGKGQVLNDTAATIFIDGIPGLNEVRPNLFENVTQYPSPDDTDFTQPYQAELVWQEMVGPDITIAMTSLGNIFSLSGQIMGMIIAFLIFAMIASVGFGFGHGIAGMAISFPVILAGVYTGFVLLTVLGVLCFIAALVLVWQFIFKGG